jgi:hypothetical protein
MNDEQMAKALKDLIDETIAEIEDLKKSDRFSASEIKIEGPGEGIDGKPVNGKLDAQKADDEEDEDEDEEMDEEAKKAESCEKGVLDEAETKPIKKEEDKDEEDKDDDKEDKKVVQKEVDSAMKKSIDASEELMKSYIDSKIAPIEDKINSILNAVKELADTPVARKSVPFNAQPLIKSDVDGVQPLNKSEVINKMLELKKSGVSVPTDDITRVELGGPADLEKFVNKYKLIRD